VRVARGGATKKRKNPANARGVVGFSDCSDFDRTQGGTLAADTQTDKQRLEETNRGGFAERETRIESHPTPLPIAEEQTVHASVFHSNSPLRV